MERLKEKGKVKEIWNGEDGDVDGGCVRCLKVMRLAQRWSSKTRGRIHRVGRKVRIWEGVEKAMWEEEI